MIKFHFTRGINFSTKFQGTELSVFRYIITVLPFNPSVKLCNTDNSVPWNLVALSRGIQANRSFRFRVGSDRTCLFVCLFVFNEAPTVMGH